MQIIDDGNNHNANRHDFPDDNNKIFGIAAIFILAGIFILGYNLGFIQRSLFRIVISWQMLLVAIGIISLARRQTTTGLILAGTGIFFLIPHISRLGYSWLNTYWPVALVFVGIVLLSKALSPKSTGHNHSRHEKRHVSSQTSENGYLYSNNSFGSVTQLVLDPVFKGATIKNRFGETILDLRRTQIEPGDTFIDVENTFGGIEIYVKEGLTVKNELSSVFSGTEDKRYGCQGDADSNYRLIIRGSATFSGVEIKC